jgi:hypothetical protein
MEDFVLLKTAKETSVIGRENMNTQIEKAITYNTNEEPIVISKPTSDKLLKLERPSDAMALYWFYYYTAKWQHTNSPHSNNIYTQKGLRWSSGRLAKAKKDLVKLGLVETVRTWNVSTKKFDVPLLRINFIWWNKEKIKAIPYEKQYHTKSNDIANHPLKGSTNIRKKDITNTPTADGSEDDKWDTLSGFLAKIILSTRKIATSSQKIKAWAKELKKLSTVEKVSFDRILSAMKWYSHNITGQYIPVIQCGKSFREKFGRLEAAMERENTNSVKAFPLTSSQPSIPLDPDAQRLADFTASVLGNELIRPRAIQDIVNQMRVFYGTADKFRYQYDPLKRMGPTEHYTWDKFFREWLEFLEEKQQSGFTLQSVRNLQQSDTRWREYLKQCEEYTSYDWNTGKRRE